MQLFPDGMGWLATAVFGISYFCEGAKLRLVQGVAAILWMSYGLMIHAVPVIVANLIVTGLALYSAWRTAARSRTQSAPGRSA